VRDTIPNRLIKRLTLKFLYKVNGLFIYAGQKTGQIPTKNYETQSSSKTLNLHHFKSSGNITIKLGKVAPVLN
jgi:hypothetical protein